MAPVTACKAEGVVVEVRAPTINGEPEGLKLSFRPKTYCPRENTLNDRMSISTHSNLLQFDYNARKTTVKP